MDKYELSNEKLKLNFDPAHFDFTTTAELADFTDEIIGQQRAAQSLDFGLRVKKEGYNIFMSGKSGTGKSTYAEQLAAKKSAIKDTPPDIIYVFNFADSERPNAIEVPAGVGSSFKKDMEKMMKELREEIPRAFESDEYEEEKNEIVNHYQPRSTKLMEEFEEEIHKKGFTLQNTPQGLVPVPIDEDGEPLVREDFHEMSDEEKEEIREQSQAIKVKLDQIMKQIRGIKESAQEELSSLEKKIGISVVQPIIKHLQQKYEECQEIVEYLTAVQKDIGANIAEFLPKNNDQQMPFPFSQDNEEEFFTRYQINLLIDHQDTKGAPVVFEKNPTYYNLFGKVEGKTKFGTITTDFTMIRSGAFHKANGGYLILKAEDVLRNPFSWKTLKRTLINQDIEVENIGEQYRRVPIMTLRPEAVKLDLKIILIGTPYLYYLLYDFDEEFKELFKIKADFDTEMDRNQQNIDKFATFIATICNRDGIRHFTNRSVAAMIDYSSRLADDRQKMSTRFNEIIEIIYEADTWAEMEGKDIVVLPNLLKAISEKEKRSNLLEEKVQESIIRGQIMIDVVGKEVGQINGLSIYSTGKYSFGSPSRITARTYLGKEGVINIEREVDMSGSIHSKGVMIMTGYLGGQYAQDDPLSLTASLAFEQNYGGIDGDSATCAELIALLSSLADLPIRQDLAITGSMNQKGIVQPIGGVNEKIEGFFQVCKASGLTGNQGVVIPTRNLDNLILKKEVVEAIEKGKFHLYQIENIDQAVEIMMSRPAAEVHEKVSKLLTSYAEEETITEKE